MRKCVLGASVVLLLSTSCEVPPSAPPVEVNRPQTAAAVRVARVIEPAELGIGSPAGVAYAPQSGMLLVATRLPGTPPGQVTDIELITVAGHRAGTGRIAAGVTDPAGMAFDPRANRLLVLESSTNQLIEIPASPTGTPDAESARTIDARALGVQDPRGLAVDPVTGRLFILDAAGPRILRISVERRVVSVIDLTGIASTDVRGVAFDPSSGHLHVLDPGARTLFEVAETGRLVATRDLSPFALHRPLGIAFAPSGDATDDPAELSLYIADGGGTGVAAGGKITELSLLLPGAEGRGSVATAALVAAATGSLVRTVETSRFSPPSPDPSGITYVTHAGNLTIVDGEVEEMTIYAGANAFEMSPSGSLTHSWTTTVFSREPTGVAYNPANRHLFISDDNAKAIFEVDPSGDGLYGTSDDRVTRFNTDAFASNDPEGVTYDVAQGVLFIADGVNDQVYRVAPGANGVFDGVSPAGDDQVTSFDTERHGLLDPEGIAYDADFGHLYVVGQPATLVFHFTTSGTLLRTIDISAARAVKPAGLAYGPGSANPGTMNLWIVDRGVDNNDNPNENDGKVYEFAFPPYSDNTLPAVTITAPANGSSFTEGSAITFSGTASDAEDGDLTTSLAWTSNRDGALGSGGSVTRTLSLGTHVITASVTDGDGGQASSAVTVTVNAEGAGTVLVRVAASTDDAEESATGVMDLTSSDLELVFDLSNQTVGIRFAGVAIPPGATITGASVQFQVDEAMSGATTLAITGEAADHATAFTSTTGNISSRARTASAVSWSPAAWPVIDVAGPDQQTPSLVSIVQEIVSRPGWQSGNALVLIITGTGERVAEAFNGVPAAAPLLRVDYVLGSNSTPAASDVTITGTAEVGQVLTGNYSYSDADGDPEGTSRYRWLRDGSAISGATARTYTLVPADHATLIVFEVTPVAASGATVGVPVPSPAVGPVAGNIAPTASDVTITGTAQVGQVLTGNYTYNDADGDAEGSSTYRWLRNGAPISGAVARTYILVSGDENRVIQFEVTPVAASGVSPGAAVQSPAVGPVIKGNNVPTARDVVIKGSPQVGLTLTGSYSFRDAEGDHQGVSLYRWLRDGVTIPGATARTYTLVNADAAARIVFEVTPVALTGSSPGAPVQSPPVGPVVEALTVTAISPNTLKGGTGMQATITGTGFLKGAKPTFVNGSGGPQPKAESIVFVNSTTITCIVKVGTESTPQVRTWDVKVENTNHAIGLLVGGLTVTQRQ